MEHHAADQLDVEVPLADGAPGRLSDEREGLGEQVVDGLAVPGSLAKLIGLATELGVVEQLHLGLDPVDRLDSPLILLELLRLAHPQGAVDDSSGHGTRLAGACAPPGAIKAFSCASR